jgi:hypothetical protein
VSAGATIRLQNADHAAMQLFRAPVICSLVVPLEILEPNGYA